MLQGVVREIRKRPKLRKVISFVLGLVKKSYMFIINKIIGINENKVVFMSFNGKTYSDNPRAISEKLNEMHPLFEIVWLFKKPEEKRDILPHYVRCVKTNSYKALTELATAKFWVDNFCKPLYIYKSKEQFYIQTWHGDRGFKKVLYDARTKLPNGHYKEGDLIEPKICDLAICGSTYGERVRRTAFGYNGQILKVGSPRNDQLIQNDPKKAMRVKKTLKIDQNTKVLLYAPTFRDSKRNKPQNITIDFEAILLSLVNKTGDHWICLVRSHVSSNGFNEIKENEQKLKDVSDYEDMADLLLITDFLITDFSSSVGDYILLKRPYVLYIPDRDEYILNDRQLSFELDESPYCIATNNQELVLEIERLDNTMAEKKAIELLEFYDTTETGEASKKVVEYIIDKQKKLMGSH